MTPPFTASAFTQNVWSLNNSLVKAQVMAALRFVEFHARRNALDEAVRCYERAVAVAPDYVAAWNGLGKALGRRNELPEAVARFERALALDPKNAETHNNLGLALGKQGKLDAAELHFREALRLEPGYTSARENLERVLGAKRAR